MFVVAVIAEQLTAMIAVVEYIWVGRIPTIGEDVSTISKPRSAAIRPRNAAATHAAYAILARLA